MAKETEKIIERMDKLEKELRRLSFIDQETSLRLLNNGNGHACKNFNHIMDQLDQIEKKVGYIRISLTTVLVALGFIAFEVIRHWVL